MRDPELDGALRGVRLLLLAMAGGVLAFLAVAIFLVRSGEGLAPGAVPAGALPAVGVAVLVMLLTAPVVQRSLARVGDPGATPPERISRWRVAAIVGAAVREGAGLLGIVAGLLAGSPLWIGLLGGAAVVSLLLALPGGDELEADLRRAGVRSAGR